MTDFAYDVFLSHNSKDKPAVEALAIRLEDEAGLKVFLDKWNLVPGDPWQEDLEQALEASHTVAVFLGPSGVSGWHNEEMRNALDRRVRDPERRVIPVLLPDTTMPENDEIPAFLSRLTWVDFRAGMKDEDAFHRLVAGIAGMPPGRGDTTSTPISRTPKADSGKQPASTDHSGPTFHGNFQGSYVEGNQTVINKFEDRSIHVNAPVTGSALVSGKLNKVNIGSQATLEDFTALLAQMRALLPQTNLLPEESAGIQNDLETVQAEAVKPEPNRGILLKRLGSLVEFLANAATVASTAPQLVEMARQALEWAKALY